MFSEPILPLDDFAPPEPREVRVDGVEKPVAAVLLNTFAPALSHPLDFLIPAKLDAVAVPGVLVKVKVGTKRYTGVIVERKDSTDWQKPLREIERTLGDLPLLDIPTLELLENVSLYYGTGPSALLRYALPERRVKVEQDFSTARPELDPNAVTMPPPEQTTWARYAGGVEFFSDLCQGRHPRAVVSSLPLVNNPHFQPSSRFQPIAELVAAAWSNGEQSLIVMPTVEQADEAYLYLRDYFADSDQVVLYTSEIPTAASYETFLRSRFGTAAVVVGTRGAVFLPLARPGLFFLWDDLAWSLSSDMFPNFSSRQVLLMRSQLCGVALVLAHYSVNAGDLQLVTRHFARGLTPNREVLRQCTGRFEFLSEDAQLAEGMTGAMLLPNAALRLVRRGLQSGPVLLLIPPDGAFSVVSCANCGTNAVCEVCAGPLTFEGSRLVCTRCGNVPAHYACLRCASTKLRGRHLQSRTVIDDIGRAFSGVPVLVSRPGKGRIGLVDGASRLVIAYPGGEPFATGGYEAAVILRAHMWANRTALWTAQELMRQFLAAGSLVKPEGRILVTNRIDSRLEQALVRWDPWSFAAHDLREREAGHFAPAWRTALLQGSSLSEVLAFLRQDFPEIMVFGPVPTRENPALSTAFVSVSLRDSQEFGRALRAVELQNARERKSGSSGLRIVVDPPDPAGQIG